MVFWRFFLHRGRIFSARISRAARFLLTERPRARNLACTLAAVHLAAYWRISLISCTNSTFSWACLLSGLSRRDVKYLAQALDWEFIAIAINDRKSHRFGLKKTPIVFRISLSRFRLRISSSRAFPFSGKGGRSSSRNCFTHLESR